MLKIVSDGEKRYVEANLTELQKIYEQRIAAIEDRHVTSSQFDILKRCVQYIAMKREIARASYEIFGKDNLYLFDPSSN